MNDGELKYPIQADFWHDLNEIAEAMLDDEGYKNIDSSKAVQQLINARYRCLVAKHRDIEQSDVFVCPSECIDALNLIKSKVVSGDNLTPFMTRSMKNASFKDGLLNVEHIYHFHLSTQIDKDGFMKRSGHLLMAYVDDDRFYMITIYKHNEQPFENQELINIIHRNWPELADKRKADGVIGLSYNVDDASYRLFRKANVNMLHENNGRVYGSLGDTVALDGTPLFVLDEEAVLKNMCSEIKYTMYSQDAQLHDLISSESGKSVAKMHFRLIELGAGICRVLEENTGIIVNHILQTDIFFCENNV